MKREKLIPFWYHLTAIYTEVMAMTLRLNSEQESALSFLAHTQGISKHEAALRAITDKAARILRNLEVQEYTAQEISQLKANGHVSRY